MQLNTCQHFFGANGYENHDVKNSVMFTGGKKHCCLPSSLDLFDASLIHISNSCSHDVSVSEGMYGNTWFVTL
jgi:hypothetical protein